MPRSVLNFINQDEGAAQIAAICASVPDEKLRMRLSKTGLRWAMRDKCNRAHIQPKHLVGCKQWALDRIAQGLELWFFALDAERRARLTSAAANAERCCALAAMHTDPADPQDIELRLRARHLIEKCNRLTFESIELRLRELIAFEQAAAASRKLRMDLSALVWEEPERIGVRGGAHWALARSVAELYARGRELANCWGTEKRTPQAPYAALLRAKLTRFYSLHERDGGPAVMGLMFDCGLNTIVEVRGPRNKLISLRNGAVRDFMRAKSCFATLATFDLARKVDVDDIHRIAEILSREDPAPDEDGET